MNSKSRLRIWIVTATTCFEWNCMVTWQMCGIRCKVNSLRYTYRHTEHYRVWNILSECGPRVLMCFDRSWRVFFPFSCSSPTFAFESWFQHCAKHNSDTALGMWASPGYKKANTSTLESVRVVTVSDLHYTVIVAKMITYYHDIQNHVFKEINDGISQIHFSFVPFVFCLLGYLVNESHSEYKKCALILQYSMCRIMKISIMVFIITFIDNTGILWHLYRINGYQWIFLSLPLSLDWTASSIFRQLMSLFIY